MSDLNMQLVREFFELNQFYALPHWRWVDQSRLSENSALLFVERPQADVSIEPEFLLRPGDVAGIRRAVIEVRAWHADRFYASTVENSAILGHVASSEVRDLAETVFGSAEFRTILVISEFSSSPRHRSKALEILKGTGMNHVIEFPTILGELLDGVSVQGNYAPSQTLQTLRLLKRYNFVRHQQMEFALPWDLPARQNVSPKQEEITDISELAEE